jgi:hypothetical protein
MQRSFAEAFLTGGLKNLMYGLDFAVSGQWRRRSYNCRLVITLKVSAPFDD